MSDTNVDPSVGGPEGAAAARQASATKFQRGMKRSTETPTIGSDEDYDKVPFGTDFIDPTGKTRTKMWEVKSDEDFDKVPEGSDFLDPSGQVRTKPKVEGVDFTTQTLYDMAVTDKEKFKALERAYPGKVKKEGEEVYVDDDGVRRKPGRGGVLSRVASRTLAETAPMAGMVGGGLAGAAGGPATGFGGMVLGGMGGQAFNDAILGLAGVYDRTPAQEVGNLGMSGAAGAVGEAAGRGLAMAAPWVKEKFGSPSKMAANFLGADPEGLRMAVSLAEKGVMPPASGWAKEGPHLINIHQVFDPAFHTQKPLLQSATQHYERAGADILEKTGVKEAGSLTNPTAAVSTEEAGMRVLNRAKDELAQSDAKLRTALDTRRSEVQAAQQAGVVGHEARMSALQQAERDSRAAAQKVIDEGFKSIQVDIDVAMKATQVGSNSGDLWWAVGEKLKSVKQGISARATKMYNEADELAGGHHPNIAGLAERADAFLRQLPEGFEGKYPDIVRRLKGFAGEVNADTGEIIKDVVDPTFGQLHELRNVFRSNINYHDLTPGIREGVYKHFAQKVDAILHDKNAVPELKAAAQALDKADAFYRENMRPLTDKHIQAVVSGLESGMPADPKNLFDTLVKEGRSDLTKKVADLVGPNLWAGVKAADVQEMLDMSKGLVPGMVDGTAFARQVLDRHRTNMLEAVHGRQASAKLLKQAQDVAMLNGKLDVSARPGDTVTEIIAKAKAAAEAVKQEAKLDPLSVLNKEMKVITADQQRVASKVAAERRNDPLAFLYEPSTGAAEAVDTILKSEDLILASAAKFGEKSPEFDMLRQVWVQRILQNTMEPGGRLQKVSPEVQQIMFPGVTLDQMQLLAKEMDFLMSARGVQETAKSMAATSRVEHPWGHIVGKGGLFGQAISTITKPIPFADAAGRSILGAYYGLIRNVLSSPGFLRWVERGLKSRDEKTREMVRAQLQKMLTGGQLGAGAVVGEEVYQGSGHGDFDPTSIGAQQAPDGHFYLPDPQRPGKYLQVEQQ